MTSAATWPLRWGSRADGGTAALPAPDPEADRVLPCTARAAAEGQLSW
ncbi:hypothetical protein [Blastococcus capsensis]|nr:hypothetical protein [Blastococcus capsensis]MDK3258647.1 hypothetical protein [Blastococcus capsensis]